MDGYRHLQPDNAARRGRHCHGIMSHDALGVMPDRREPVPTSSGFAISRRGRPGELAATGAAGEEGCRVQAFEDEDADPRAPHCARIITSHQKYEAAPPYAHGDSPRLHCKSATVAQPPSQRVQSTAVVVVIRYLTTT